MAKSIDKKTSGDFIHGITKGVLGAVPILGTAAAEFFGYIVSPPLEKRRIEFMNDLAERLKELEERRGIDLYELGNNEHFIDVALQAVSFALRTSRKEKIDAFKNVVLNTACAYSLDETMTQIFLNQLDRFTSWHLKVLDSLDNPLNWQKYGNERAFMRQGEVVTTMIDLSQFLQNTYPELNDKKLLIRIIWNDLKNECLIHKNLELSSHRVVDGILKERLTEMGKEFLRFIRFV